LLILIAICKGTGTSSAWIREEYVLLAVVALRKLIVLLPLARVLALALVRLLVVVAIEIYLDARARGLDIVQHVLNVIHDAREVEELLTVLSLLSSLPWWHALMRSFRTSWPCYSTWELLEVLVCLTWQPSSSVDVGVAICLLVRRLAAVPAICCLPLLSMSVLLSTLMSSMRSRGMVSPSLRALLLHIGYPVSCLVLLWHSTLLVVLLVLPVARVSLLLVQLGIHHVKLSVNFFDLILA
jgi:hypothetical protein